MTSVDGEIVSELDKIYAAVTAGFWAVENLPSRAYSIDGVYDNGPVRYSDPRINVVTEATIRFFGYYTTHHDMNDMLDLATFGNLVIAALDEYDKL